MQKTNFYLDKVSLFLIISLPVGLLISSGVSEIIQILITIFFLITCIYNKNLYWIKNKYFLLLLIIWISLLINLLFSQNFILSSYRNIFFLVIFKISLKVFYFLYSSVFKRKKHHYFLIKNLTLGVTPEYLFHLKTLMVFYSNFGNSKKQNTFLV